MLEKPKSKQDIRKEIDKAISRYVQTGGKIEQVKQGISGCDDNTNLNQSIPLTQGQKQTRTLLNETVKAIDERKQKKKTPTPKQLRPKKRIIYDDFGEAIREIWE